VVIERDDEDRPQTWLYGPYLIVCGGGSGDVVFAGYRHGRLPGVYDLPEDIDGLPLEAALERIRAAVAKSKDVRRFLAKWPDQAGLDRGRRPASRRRPTRDSHQRWRVRSQVSWRLQARVVESTFGMEVLCPALQGVRLPSRKLFVGSCALGVVPHGTEAGQVCISRHR
jgi:hypothetical protein